LFLISHIHRRPRLPGPLPQDPAHGRKDPEKSPFKASPADSGAGQHDPLLDEISQ
jgi:hypothetical protein